MFQGNVTRYLISMDNEDIVVKRFPISLLRDACASNLSRLKQIPGVGARCYRRHYVQIKWTSRRNEKRQQQQQHKRAGLVMEVWMTISAGVETRTRAANRRRGRGSRSGLIAPQILTPLIFPSLPFLLPPVPRLARRRRRATLMRALRHQQDVKQT